MVIEAKTSKYKILNVICFVLMVTVNAAANIIPINGITTGGVADSYPNLFAPAGFTFAIWGVIYLLLAGFVVFQFATPLSDNVKSIFKDLSSCFIISCIANVLWIFRWHYKVISISMILMVIILISLIIANQKINHTINPQELTKKEKIFVRLPFSVYFGWITVATIANAAIYLVSINWSGWGLSEQLWTIIVIGLGMLIAVATTLRNKDIAYGITVCWGYLGILVRHISPSGFAGEYPGIMYAVSIAIVVILSTVLFILTGNKCCKKCIGNETNEKI